jgi:hypothetical protein
MDILRPRLFTGEWDCEKLRLFFQPSIQYAGDTLWQFGKGLRGSYLDFFEYNEYMPLSYLWFDEEGFLGAVSNICGKSGLLRHQCHPNFRNPQVSEMIIVHDQTVLAAVNSDVKPLTLLYDRSVGLEHILVKRGYERSRLRGVELELDLRKSSLSRFPIEGIIFTALDSADPVQIAAREEVQTQAFSDSDPWTKVWQHRNIARSLAFVDCAGVIEIVGTDIDGRMVTFASIILDEPNSIGEIRPLGTVRDHPLRDLLTAGITIEAIHVLREAGYDLAVAKMDFHDSGDLAQGVSEAEEAISRAGMLGFTATARLYEYKKL